MSTLTAPDGARIFYKDWGRGQPILFSHGWPLSADAWDNQLLFFGQSGFRVIAHDRRGHGRSDQTWHGNDINQYADDLALLIETLDLRDLILVGHSTGGGEVARYIGRHGSDRVAKVVLVGAVPPLMLQTNRRHNDLASENAKGTLRAVLRRGASCVAAGGEERQEKLVRFKRLAQHLCNRVSANVSKCGEKNHTIKV